MKPRITVSAVVGMAALVVAVAGTGASSVAGLTPQTGNAVLTVTSGFTTSPNPLAGRTMVLFKESFGGFLKRKGWFQGPPGATVKESPLAVWVYSCRTGSPVCQEALFEARPNSVAEAKMDANARATLPGVPPGTYYLFAITPYSGQALVWDLRVDLKPGLNSVTLDQRNTASLEAESAPASPPGGAPQGTAGAAAQPTAAPQPCKGVDEPRTIKPGVRGNSTLSVIGMGYVYTYTQTDRVTGRVISSATERGNFINSTLYLLDEDADTILQRAGVESSALFSRLQIFVMADTLTQVEGVAPGLGIDLANPGIRLGKELYQGMFLGNADPQCMAKAISAHSFAEMTTDVNARGTFPGVPAGTYYLFGRFYRVTKPVRTGGLLWNLKIELKPGQNVLRLSVDDAAWKQG